MRFGSVRYWWELREIETSGVGLSFNLQGPWTAAFQTHSTARLKRGIYSYRDDNNKLNSHPTL
jgi:hypothetical protein